MIPKGVQFRIAIAIACSNSLNEPAKGNKGMTEVDSCVVAAHTGGFEGKCFYHGWAGAIFHDYLNNIALSILLKCFGAHTYTFCQHAASNFRSITSCHILLISRERSSSLTSAQKHYTHIFQLAVPIFC